MITTVYGTELKVVEPMDRDGYAKFKRIKKGDIKEYHCSQIKCDTKDEIKSLLLRDK